jgi:hypothetical protein
MCGPVEWGLRRWRIVSLVLTVTLSMAANPAAQVKSVAASVPRVVDVAPLATYRPQLDDETLEVQTWDYTCWFASGHRLIAQFQITNAGPGRHTGLVAGIVIFPDKTTRLIKNSRPSNEWQFDVAGEQVRLTLVRHVFEIGPRRHRVHIESGTDRLDFVAEATLPAVLMGPVRFGARDVYDIALLAPRFRVTATVETKGAPPVTLADGWGVAAHSTSTLPDHEQALSIARFHTFDRPTQISMLGFTVPKELGGGRVGWLLSMGGGRMDIETEFDRHFGGDVRETEEPDYYRPSTLHLRSASAGIETTASLQLAARFDIISWIRSAVGRFWMRRRFHPIEYVFEAPYELTTRAEHFTGDGLALVWILKQPAGATWP